jgi:hypothetical protein
MEWRYLATLEEEMAAINSVSVLLGAVVVCVLDWYAMALPASQWWSIDGANHCHAMHQHIQQVGYETQWWEKGLRPDQD